MRRPPRARCPPHHPNWTSGHTKSHCTSRVRAFAQAVPQARAVPPPLCGPLLPPCRIQPGLFLQDTRPPLRVVPQRPERAGPSWPFLLPLVPQTLRARCWAGRAPADPSRLARAQVGLAPGRPTRRPLAGPQGPRCRAPRVGWCARPASPRGPAGGGAAHGPPVLGRRGHSSRGAVPPRSLLLTPSLAAAPRPPAPGARPVGTAGPSPASQGGRATPHSPKISRE